MQSLLTKAKAMKRKIALIKRRFGKYGGLEKYAYRLTQAFSEEGCEVHILTTETTAQNWLASSVFVHRFDVESILGFRTIDLFDKACSRWLSKNKMDVVFGLDRAREQTHLRAGNGVHAAYLQQRKISDSFFKQCTYSLNPLHKLILDIEKQGFENPRLKRLFTNSFLVKNQILETYSTEESKITVVHNGVEWKEYASHFSSWLEAKAKIAGGSKIDPTSFQFLFIGNGYQRKGLAYLLQGLSLLKEKDFHLSVVGKEKNVSIYKQMAEKLGLSSKVTFFGTQKNSTPFYQLADALVIPSIYDPFANVTVEALAMGVYVISSSFNGGKEVLQPHTGTTIESLANPESMKYALETAMLHPKTWLRSQNIRESVQYLDFSNQLEAIVRPCLND